MHSIPLARLPSVRGHLHLSDWHPVFLSIYAFEKCLAYIYIYASLQICVLNIYESGGILYLSFCNLLSPLNILFLRIIHVDADRKLNSISDSENIPAH